MTTVVQAAPIATLREQIDALDGRLLELLNERAGCLLYTSDAADE